jgi:hypothetical protein
MSTPSTTPDLLTFLRERIAALAKGFYHQVTLAPPTALELVVWLESMDPAIHKAVLEHGLRPWLSLRAFQAHVLAQRGKRLEAHMQRHLAPDEFAFWQEGQVTFPPLS